MVTNWVTPKLCLENQRKRREWAREQTSQKGGFLCKVPRLCPPCVMLCVGPCARVNVGLINAHGRATRPTLPPMPACSSPSLGDPSGMQTPDRYPPAAPSNKVFLCGWKET